MGERKVINNYISPDFDPSLIPKIKRSKDRTIETRMMLPFSMQCNTCGEYLYRGKKFNSKMEICKGEDYMGIRRFRFYIKCAVCSAEISFKTDPKNTDYECESGASRNFEVWRDTEQAQDEVKQQREEEDEHDTMKALENRTLDSKIEMDVLDALDEIKAINQRHERVDTNAVLASLHRSSNKADSAVLPNGLTAEDEALVRSIKFKSSAAAESSSTGPASSNSSAEAESESTLDQVRDRVGGGGSSALHSSSGAGTGAASLLQKQLQQQQHGITTTLAAPANKPVIVLKKRKADSSSAGSAQPAKVSNTAQAGAADSKQAASGAVTAAVPSAAPVATPAPAPAAAASMFGDYGDDSD
jgi:hypothetical protein